MSAPIKTLVLRVEVLSYLEILWFNVPDSILSTRGNRLIDTNAERQSLFVYCTYPFRFVCSLKICCGIGKSVRQVVNLFLLLQF